jgi:hypothetical protein
MKSAVMNLFTLSLGGKNQLVTFRFLSASKNLSTRSSQVPFYPKALGGKKSTRNFPLPICLKKLVNSQQPSAILLYASRRKQSAILRKIYYLFSKFLSMTLNFLVLMSNAKEIICPMIIRHWILVHSKQNYLVFQKFIIYFPNFFQ